jgi:dGTPase
MTIRERTEQLERETLSPYAALSAQTRGRRHPETPCVVRTEYQRDRDRIIHNCKAFRRLAHKTQVFISPRGDHYRTRLTHTLEVAQIARTIAKALRLNEELTEAIALAHDVGHTPFGHAGEWALDAAYRQHDPEARFSHHEHSLRVVDELERDGSGLNLTEEVRDGIVAHSKGEANLESALEENLPLTLEAMVVRISDRIAYVNHDIDDALRAGLIALADLPQEALALLGVRHSQRVHAMVADLITASLDQDHISMTPPVVQAVNQLKDFLFEHVYISPGPKRPQLDKVSALVQGLFLAYMENDAALHEAIGLVPPDRKLRARLVCDWIAGMTDRFARQQYVHLFLPTPFDPEASE